MSELSQQKRVADRFVASLAHCRKLGISVNEVNQTSLQLKLDFNLSLIGNPETQVIHGGVITTLLDTACGTSVILSLPELELCPTLDLRVDYVKAALPGKPIFANAESYRLSRHVVFTRAIAHQGADDDPIAHCVATFMRLGEGMTPTTYKEYLLDRSQA